VNAHIKTTSLFLLPDIYHFHIWVQNVSTTNIQILHGYATFGSARLTFFRLASSNSLSIGWYDGTPKTTTIPNVFTNDGVWIDLDFTFNFITGAYTIQRNAASVATGTLTNIQRPAANYLYIGQDSTLISTQGFKGTIDEPRIYNRAPSAEEVYSLYKFPSQSANQKNRYSISGTVDRIQDARRVGAIVAHFAPLHLVPTVLGFTAATAGNPNPVPTVPTTGGSITSISAVARSGVSTTGLARTGKAS